MLGFPKTTGAALKGEAGVNLVAWIITSRLGWLFRRTHGEHDFGIDGYVDLTTDSGEVTGRCLAVQIKYGERYFSQRTEHGYTYYGDRKHLNYLINHPVPTLILLCNPISMTCYWAHFCPEQTEPTEQAWKLTVPFENILDPTSKPRLAEIAGAPEDFSDRLDRYWRDNQALCSARSIAYVIPRTEIEALEFKSTLDFFDRLSWTKKLCLANQGKIDLCVFGYDDDPRELWEVPEVVRWMKAVEPMVKYWFYFLSARPETHGLTNFAWCVCDVERDREAPKPPKGFRVILDEEALPAFIDRNFRWLNEFAAKIGLPEAEIERISLDVSRRFRIALGDPENV